MTDVAAANDDSFALTRPVHVGRTHLVVTDLTRPANLVALGGSAGGQPVSSIVRRSRAGRLGWREVVDWEAMRNAASQR